MVTINPATHMKKSANINKSLFHTNKNVNVHKSQVQSQSTHMLQSLITNLELAVNPDGHNGSNSGDGGHNGEDSNHEGNNHNGDKDIKPRALTAHNIIFSHLLNTQTDYQSNIINLTILHFVKNHQSPYPPRVDDLIKYYNRLLRASSNPKAKNINLSLENSAQEIVNYTWDSIKSLTSTDKLRLLELSTTQLNKNEIVRYFAKEPNIQFTKLGQQHMLDFLNNSNNLTVSWARHLIKLSPDQLTKLGTESIAWKTLSLTVSDPEYQFLIALYNHRLLRTDITVDNYWNNANKIVEIVTQYSDKDNSAIRPSKKNQIIDTLLADKSWMASAKNGSGGANKIVKRIQVNTNEKYLMTVVKNAEHDEKEYANEEKVLRWLSIHPEQLTHISPQIPVEVKFDNTVRKVGLIPQEKDEQILNKYLNTEYIGLFASIKKSLIKHCGNLFKSTDNAIKPKLSPNKAVAEIIKLNETIMGLGRVGISHKDLHIENIKVGNNSEDTNNQNIQEITVFDFGLTSIYNIDGQVGIADWQYLLVGGDYKRRIGTLATQIFMHEKKYMKHNPFYRILEAAGVDDHKIKHVQLRAKHAYHEIEKYLSEFNSQLINFEEYSKLIEEVITKFNVEMAIIVLDNDLSQIKTTLEAVGIQVKEFEDISILINENKLFAGDSKLHAKLNHDIITV